MYDDFDITKRKYNQTFFDKNTSCFNHECQQERTEFPSDNYHILEAVLLTGQAAYKINIAHYKCHLCNYLSKYDGLHDHVINFDSKLLASHDVMNSVTYYMVNDPQPSDETIFGLYQSNYENNGSFKQFPCIKNAAIFWRSFIWLQAWKLWNVCPLCDASLMLNVNNAPAGWIKKLVCDGVFVAHNKRYSHMIRNPKYIFRPDYILPNACNNSDRLITNKGISLLMIRLSIQHLGTIRADWVCFCIQLVYA